MDIAPTACLVDGGHPDTTAVKFKTLNVEEFAVQLQRAFEACLLNRIVE
jgi:hypothetical protein